MGLKSLNGPEIQHILFRGTQRLPSKRRAGLPWRVGETGAEVPVFLVYSTASCRQS